MDSIAQSGWKSLCPAPLNFSLDLLSMEVTMHLSHVITRHLLAASLVIAAAFVVPPAAAQAAQLDGKVFVADAGEKGKAADEKADVITFQNGKFHSSLCDQYGYNKGAYKSAAQGDAISFEAETTSEKDGRLVWKGSVKGDIIEGTFIHYRKPGFFNSNPAPIEHWFKGKAKG